MRQAFVRENLDFWFAADVDMDTLVFAGNFGRTEKEARLELSRARLADESIVETTVSYNGRTFDVIMLDVIDPLPTKLRYPVRKNRPGCLLALLFRFI